MKLMLPVVDSNGALPPNEVGRIAEHVREKEEKDDCSKLISVCRITNCAPTVH